jgi:hypothetical protein
MSEHPDVCSCGRRCQQRRLLTADRHACSS